MATIPDDNSALEVAPHADLTRMQLTVEEGATAARLVGRRMSIKDLVREGVLDAARARAVVASLAAKGVLTIATTRTVGRDPYAGMSFSPVDMQDPNDLSEEQRKRVLFLEAKLTSWSHYALLGLKRTANVADIKQGYFKASKEFHPDAYFRKNLGRYKERIDRIFRAMKNAYDTLSDTARRAAYDSTLIADLTPEEEADIERIAADKMRVDEDRARMERHEQRLADQRVKRNPMHERLKRGMELMKLADAAVAGGRTQEAANHARLAADYIQHDDKLKARADELVKLAGRERAGLLLRRVEALLKASELREVGEEVNALLDQAADLAVGDATLLVDTARIMNRLGRKNRAVKLAQQALEASDRNIDALEIVAEAAAADDKWHTALRAAERLLEIKPSHVRGRELLKIAKRGLG